MIRSSELQSVLIIVPYAIGDYIVSTSLFEWLRLASPQARVDIVTSPLTQALAERDPRLARVGVVSAQSSESEMVAEVSAFVGDTHYDVVYAPAVHFMTRAMRMARTVTGRPIIVGSEQQRRSDVYLGFFDHLIPHYYPMRHWCESYALAGPLAIEHPEQLDVGPSLGGFSTTVTSTDPSRIVVNLSAKEAKRTIDTRQAIEILRALLHKTRTVRIQVLAGPQEVDRQREIVNAVSDERVEGVHGSLSDVVALIGAAAVVISPDTSIVHMASSVGTPVVGLYLQPHKVIEWGPFGVPFRALISGDPTTLTSISASEVTDAAMALLQEQGSVL